MRSNNLTIGFVRRGFSSSGGAESYLKRLASGVVEKGHQVRLYTSGEWPPGEWTFGPLIHLKGRSAIAFADEVKKLTLRSCCDVLMSLERIWQCDVYRAGDGVHRAWLERRAEIGGPFQRLRRILNRKHSATLALEKSLFADCGADRVIANSGMVRDEIVRFYGFPDEKIDVVYNGVPFDAFRRGEESRAKIRKMLGLKSKDIAVLFAGSGWERKGLRFAIEALEASGKETRLLVAGHGDKRKFRSARVEFLEVVQDMSALYGAADIFLLPTIYEPFSNACPKPWQPAFLRDTRANGFSGTIEEASTARFDDPRTSMGFAKRFGFGRTRPAQRPNRESGRARQFDIAQRRADAADSDVVPRISAVEALQ
jgi:UDP-glucose:(heptosyl)LPS alpha-1,3-glucosyltransferase